MTSKFSDAILSRVGAWQYGMSIIDDILAPNISGVKAPKYVAFDMDANLLEVIRHIELLGQDWAIKYSRSGKHFTHSVKRGENSSLGRTIHLNSQVKEFLTIKVDRVFEDAPHNTVKVIFQELIDQSCGYLFHAEITSDLVEVEVLFDQCRSIVFAGVETPPYTEASSPTPLPHFDISVTNDIVRRLQNIRNVLFSTFSCVSWSLEGFWSFTEPSCLILQLRPTPLDRPIHLSAELTTSQSKILFESAFVWGLCDKMVAIKDGEFVADGLLSLCKCDRRSYESHVLYGFASGSIDLVIRSSEKSASRLSHEPWFLPPPEYRSTFCHAWVPDAIIARQDSKSLRLVSDGHHICLIDQV